LAEGDAQTTQCPAENGQHDDLDAGSSGLFVFAGIEPDLTTADLQQVGTAPDGNTVYTGSDSTITEIYEDSTDGLLRYILVDSDGVPSTFRSPLTFGGQNFTFDSQADDIDRTTLARAGCAGPFGAFSDPNESAGSLNTLYISVGSHLL